MAEEYEQIYLSGGLFVFLKCNKCGSMVWDREQHTEWHASFVKTKVRRSSYPFQGKDS